MKLYQHLPAYFDPYSIERQVADVSSLEELKAVDWIARWLAEGHLCRSGPAKVVNWPSGPHIMIESEDKLRWWVIARAEAGEMPPWLAGLPEWKPPEQRL